MPHTASTAPALPDILPPPQPVYDLPPPIANLQLQMCQQMLRRLRCPLS